MNKYRALPPPMKENPFQFMLVRELEKNGWVNSTFKSWRPFELISHRKDVQVLYYHWPESFWRASGKVKMFMKAIQFIILNKFAQVLGYKLVFSVHNVLPHRSEWMRLEVFMRRWIFKNFDLFVGHASNCLSEIQSQFKIEPRKYILAPHGLYESYYEQLASKDIPVEILDLVKPSKGSSNLLLFFNTHHEQDCIQFLKKFVNSPNAKRVVLTIVGDAANKAKEITDKADNIRVYPDFFPSEHLDILMKSTDGLVIPYQRITTSGMFFLALTYKVPIISNDLDFFVTHDPQSQSRVSLEQLFTSDHLAEELSKKRNEMTKVDFASHFSWQKSGRLFANALNDLL